MTSSEKKQLLCLFLFSFVLRLLVFVTTPVVGTDSCNFVVVARHFSEGRFHEGLQQPIHPLFPGLIYLFSLITGEYEFTGKAVSLLFGTLTTLPVYFLARSLFTHKVALFASFLLAINPAHVRYSADIVSESTYIFFFVTSIWLAWEASLQRKGYIFFLTGLSIFAAYLTRAEGIVLLFIILFWLSLSCLLDIRHTLWKELVHLSLIVVVFILGSMPYLFFIHKQTGLWLFSRQLAVSQFMGLQKAKELIDRGTTVVPTDKFKVVKVRTQLKGSRPDSIKLAVWKEKGRYHMIGLYILNTYAKVYYLPFLPFLFFGLFRFTSPEVTYKEVVQQLLKVLILLKGLHLRLASKNPRAEYLLLGLCIIYFFIFFKFALTNYYLRDRYILPLVVISYPWGGVGLQVVSEYLSKAFPSLRDTSFGLSRATIVLVVISLVLTLPKDLKVKRQEEVVQKLTGKWIKEHCPEKKPIIMGLEKVAFYANGEFASISILDLESYENLAESALCRGVDYLVFCEEIFELTNLDLLRKINSCEEFSFIKEWVAREKKGDKHLRLYKFHPFEYVQKLAGKWIGEHCPVEHPVIAGLENVEKVAFYAYGELVSISGPDLECYERFVEKLRSGNVKFLVFYVEEMRRVNPDLLREINSGKDFRFLNEWGGGSYHLRLYRFGIR